MASITSIASLAPQPAQSQRARTPTPTPMDPSKYRGATVEDLDLAPALSITPSTSISTALAMSYDRDYSQLTVISPHTRSLLGYISVSKLKDMCVGGNVMEKDTVAKAMTRFDRRRGVNVYRVITPNTTLEDLEVFLRSEKFAVITDERRRFVLGVATRGDLEEFVKRRPG